MPTITHTPAPYPSTILSLSPSEQASNNYRVQTVTLFPPSYLSDQVFPAGFVVTTPSGNTSGTYTLGDTNVLPLPLRALADQILADYIRQGPTPAPPPLSPRAERAYPGTKLGRRASKGRWI